MLIGVLVVLWVGSLYLAQFVTTSASAREIISDFGYFGILMMAIVSGLNVLLPVPAATFTPVFVAAGLWLPLIILALVVGTTIADLIGYVFGKWSREFAVDHYPKTYKRIMSLCTKRHIFLLPFVLAYAAFVPFPNEAVIIPLALIGIRFTHIFIPLILGTTINQSVLALSTTGVFSVLF